MFEIGEKVVHPHHGVGEIVKVEAREFARGDIHQYYEVQIPGGSTVWVPVDLSNSGLRKLAHREELNRCREILTSEPTSLVEDGHVRQSTLAAHLKRGTIAAQCEVVRDLSAFIARKSTYGTLTAFLETVLRVLSQEWAIVAEVTVPEAMTEIHSLLQKSG